MIPVLLSFIPLAPTEPLPPTFTTPAIVRLLEEAKAADPAPATIPDLVARIKELRAKQADLAKQEADAVAAMLAEKKRLDGLIDDLGVSPKPTPPKPVDPPKPDDPLAAKLAEAFKADTGDAVQKRDDAKQLAALYEAATGICSDKTLKTPRELLAKVRNAGDSLAKGRLDGVRTVLRSELQAALVSGPVTDESIKAALDASLTDATCKKYAELFGKAAGILEGLAK